MSNELLISLASIGFIIAVVIWFVGEVIIGD